MWSSASCSSVGDSVVNKTSECFLQGRSHLTVQVGVAAAMARSEEVISVSIAWVCVEALFIRKKLVIYFNQFSLVDRNIDLKNVENCLLP